MCSNKLTGGFFPLAIFSIRKQKRRKKTAWNLGNRAFHIPLRVQMNVLKVPMPMPNSPLLLNYFYADTMYGTDLGSSLWGRPSLLKMI